MKILVLGGEGMLGHKMFQTLGGSFEEVYCTLFGAKDDEAHARFDIFRGDKVIDNVNAMDLNGLSGLLGELKPDYVVNCIGIVKQRPDATAYVPSITLNSLLPHVIADTAARWGGRLVHFSTDCVFDGMRGGYTEDDAPTADDLYGRSKFLGEVPSAANALTLRTSIIGRELMHFKSLLEWFLAQNHQKIGGYRRVYYSGVTTNHISDLVGDIIERHPALNGLYQVTSETITKHDLLCLLRDAFALDIEIIPDSEVFSDRSMKGDKLKAAIGYVCPPWPELAAQLANDPTPYAKWRDQGG